MDTKIKMKLLLKMSGVKLLKVAKIKVAKIEIFPSNASVAFYIQTMPSQK